MTSVGEPAAAAKAMEALRGLGAVYVHRKVE